jgi:Nucleotidyl transferase of unknown function (DUF2204)
MLLNQDFKEFAQLLNAHGVEYLIVGGYALMAHGHVRNTGDIDFWVNPTPQNANRLMKVLNEFGMGSLGIQAESLSVVDTVIQMGFPPARIDLLTSIEGVDFAQAYPVALKVVVDQVPLMIISREHFLKNKRALGRHKDLADVEALDPQHKRAGSEKS